MLTIEAEQVDPDSHRVLTVNCRAHQEDGLHAVDIDVWQAEDTFCASPAAKAIWPDAQRISIRIRPPAGSFSTKVSCYTACLRRRDRPGSGRQIPRARSSREPWPASVSPCRDRCRFVLDWSVGRGRWCRSKTPACPTEPGDRRRPHSRKPCSGARAFRIWLAT